MVYLHLVPLDLHGHDLVVHPGQGYGLVEDGEEHPKEGRGWIVPLLPHGNMPVEPDAKGKTEHLLEHELNVVLDLAHDVLDGVSCSKCAALE